MQPYCTRPSSTDGRQENNESCRTSGHLSELCSSYSVGLAGKVVVVAELAMAAAAAAAARHVSLKSLDISPQHTDKHLVLAHLPQHLGRGHHAFTCLCGKRLLDSDFLRNSPWPWKFRPLKLRSRLSQTL